MDKLGAIQDQIKRNRSDFNTKLEQIRADEDLTPEARKRKLAEAHREADAKHRELYSQLQQARVEQRQYLHDKAFRPTLNGVANEGEKALLRSMYAQTYQQVRGKGADLKALYEASRLADDRLGMLAIGAAAFERGNEEVLELFKRDNKTRAETLAELEQFEVEHGQQDLTAKLVDRLSNIGPQTPKELT